MTHIIRIDEMFSKTNIKQVSMDFTDSLKALKWLEYSVGLYQWGVAYVVIKGKNGYLTFGYDINDKDNEELYLHCDGFEGRFKNLTKEYNEMPTGEFCDLIDYYVIKYGD